MIVTIILGAMWIIPVLYLVVIDIIEKRDAENAAKVISALKGETHSSGTDSRGPA